MVCKLIHNLEVDTDRLSELFPPKMSSLESRKLTEKARTPCAELKEWLMIKRERYHATIKSFGESELRQLLGKFSKMIFRIRENFYLRCGTANWC